MLASLERTGLAHGKDLCAEHIKPVPDLLPVASGFKPQYPPLSSKKDKKETRQKKDTKKAN